jgi:hypothetical protein
MDRIPLASEAARYDVNRIGEVEGLRQSIYDFQLYPLAGSLGITFFANPRGAGITTSPGAAVGSAKTITDTNMELAGQLPNPKAFLVESIEILFFPGSSAAANTFVQQPPYDSIVVAPTDVNLLSAVGVNDVWNVLNTGHLQFFIGSKSYLDETPLHRFPPKSFVGVDGGITTAAVAAAATQSLALAAARAMGRPYFLDPPIFLRATQNFNVTLDWPALVPTLSTFNGRIGVVMDGYLYRNSQ